MNFTGFNVSFANRLLAGFSLSLVLVFGVGYISYKSISELNADNKKVMNTYEVIQKIKALEQQLIDVETGMRGYVITGNSDFLDLYKKAIERIPFHIDELQELTSDNSIQQRNIAGLRPIIIDKLQDFEMKVALRAEKGFESAQASVATGNGKRLMDKIRAQLKVMVDEEEGLLKIRLDRTQKSLEQTQQVIIGGTLLILLIVVVLILYIRTTFEKQKVAEAKLQIQNQNLEELSLENKRRNWLLSGAGELNQTLRVEGSIMELSNNIISFFANYLNLPIGALYLVGDREKHLYLSGSYAFKHRKRSESSIAFGEGLVGQAALENKSIIFTNVPDDYIHINSGLGESRPKNIAVYPLAIGKEVKGVIELGSATDFTKDQLEFIEFVIESAAIALNAAQARIRTAELLEETQQQAEELEQQQEELRQTNEELASQTQLLQASEEELRVQQEELKQTNVELEEKAQELEEKNDAIEQARQDVMLKAQELEQTSKYKSEFLANMSHELRTPLNSVLILAKLMMENKDSNLTDKQVEYAQVIHKSGNDLLNLINDILDLSKIEAGKIDFNIEPVSIDAIKNDIVNIFKETANQKKINFELNVKEDVPSMLVTDKMRVEQVLKNLLSNAFKFTAAGGSVQMNVFRANTKLSSISFYDKVDAVGFEVIDSGIGIPAEKQALIFEAFQQADGSTSRRYGGTGLGLSISKELVHRLGGEIHLKSEDGKGSVFTIYLPVNVSAAESKVLGAPAEQMVQALRQPTKENIHIDQERTKKVVLLHPDAKKAASIVSEIEEQEPLVKVVPVASTKEALKVLANASPQLLIVNLELTELDVLEWIAKTKTNKKWQNLNIIAHTTKGLSAAEDEQLKRMQIAAVMHSLKAADRLVEELHLLERQGKTEVVLNPDYQPVLDDVLKDRHVLLVDDDMRNIFALSNVLELNQMKVLTAGDGREAISILKQNPQIEIVLMDMMMPEMDGYEAMTEIRKVNKYKNLPMLALTAKAMQGDREKCIEAGASDYISKPVNIDQLLSLMKVWLYK